MNSVWSSTGPWFDPGRVLLLFFVLLFAFSIGLCLILLQMETAKMYQTAGVNPLAGCLPSLATIPVFIGLYR